MSRAQLKLKGIRNSEIPVEQGTMRTGYRPPRYGRAAILEAEFEGEKIGLVDLKGVGLESADFDVKQFEAAGNDQPKIDKVRTNPNSSGGMDLAEAIRETARQQATQRHLVARDLPYETVETYFIIELPFRWLREKGRTLQAAIYGRQAHYGREHIQDEDQSQLKGVLREGAMVACNAR
jgi:hypothetical protein